jgi:hypothetical protein
MIKEISRTKELEKLFPSTPLNSPEHLKAIEEMNEEMAKVRRDYIRKAAESERSASECYINC